MEFAEFDEYAMQDYSRLADEEVSRVLKGNSHEDIVRYKVFYLKKFLEGGRTNSPALKLLDYGCGIGALSKAIFRAMPQIVIHGFDVSSESVRRVSTELLVKGNRFTSDLNDLDADYDVAVLSVVLHHVELTERIGVLKNIYKRLRLGGKLIVIENNMKNPLTRNLVAHAVVDRNAHMLSPVECEDLLCSAGFSKISSRYIIFFPKQLAWLRWLDKYLARIPFGAQYMTIGEKLA